MASKVSLCGLVWILAAGTLFFALFGLKPASSEFPAGSRSSPDARPMAERNVLRFGLHVSALGNMDPHFAAGSQDRALADMLFNSLLRYQPGNAPIIETDLASRLPEFEMVDGRQVWTVRLRKGVMFHPGPGTPAYEMTADDVVYSLQKSAQPQYCAYAGEYDGMTVTRVDRYTVHIELQKPLSAVLFLPKLTNYAGGFIVSKRAIETMGYARFKNHPIGTGPFAFHRHDPGDKLVLAAHETYFRGKPRLKGVELHFMPDIKEREALLKKGGLDVIIGSGEKMWGEEMARAKDIRVDYHGVGEVISIYFNTSIAPLNDVRVRKAMAYAIDRKAFLGVSSDKLAGVVYSPVPAQFLPGGLKKEEVEFLGLDYPTDILKASQLFAEAGYPHGFALDLISSEKRLYRGCYELLRDQLARVGIRCRVQVVTHSEMHRLIRSEALPIVIYTAWRPNADAFLSRFFHSDATVATGVLPDTNFCRYGQIDRLIEGARLEIVPEKQIHLWKQAQIRILDDMAAYPLIFTNQCSARRACVDYGHPLISTMALYPQFTEQTTIHANPCGWE